MGVVLPIQTFSILAGAENSIRSPFPPCLSFIFIFIPLDGRSSVLTLKVTPDVSSSPSESDSSSDIVGADEFLDGVARRAWRADIAGLAALITRNLSWLACDIGLSGRGTSAATGGGLAGNGCRAGCTMWTFREPLEVGLGGRAIVSGRTTTGLEGRVILSGFAPLFAETGE